MLFDGKKNRPFNEESVLAIDEGQKGCYGIYNKDKWIYVGSGDIRERMLSHVYGNNECIISHNPTHWVAFKSETYLEDEKELILQLTPVCNKRVG